MRLFFTFSLFLLFSFSSIGQSTSGVSSYEGFTHQGLNWDSSNSDVRKAFPDYLASGDNWTGPTTVGKLEALHFFGFTGESLEAIAFSFLEEHTNKNMYIEDFNYIKKMLVQKYGEPSREETKWRNSLFKDSPEDYGLAVSRGDLVYRASWELPDTNISLTLKGDNYEMQHLLVYIPLEKMKNISSDKALEKL